ncbi:MAG: Biotin--[acetyl-CoA-carboxylase] ligase [Bacteroidota bacterium]
MGNLGKNIIWIEECESTNKIGFEECLNNNAESGTIWIADHQTGGRGQRGNTWLSEPGKNLLFSFNLKIQELSLEKQFYLSKAVAVGIREGIANYLAQEGKSSDELKIKWPNDLYWFNKKIGGILIENHISKGKWGFSIIGIGLNINQEEFILNSAISLKKIIGKDLDRTIILGEIILALKESLHFLNQKEFEGLDKIYHQELLGRDEWNKFQETDSINILGGKIRKVNESGKLELETKFGIKHYDLKEISIILD